MNNLTLNIRGCGSSVKRKRLQYHLKHNNIDVCMIQETKVQLVDDNLVMSLWGIGRLTGRLKIQSVYLVVSLFHGKICH